MEIFVYKNSAMLRCGYTTGTCAALAAKGAAALLFTGSMPGRLSIMTPKKVPVTVTPLAPETGARPDGQRYARCAVKKDAGDDPDATDGLLIFADVERASPEARRGDEREMVFIGGGEGVGRVTKRGLNQPVGAAAINEVPRSMIREAVLDVMEECGAFEPVQVTISVPGGEQAAIKTFNPSLGITGGISILGTSGIVEPMSEEALVGTIRAELKVLAAEGRRYLVAVPGNLGAEYLQRHCLGGGSAEIALPLVKYGNFVGKTVDMAAELGFAGLLFAGHAGKLVKLGNGIMNTHSSEGDGRMDTLISCALAGGAGIELLRAIQDSNTTEEAVDLLEKDGSLEIVMKILLGRIESHLKRRAGDRLLAGAMVFSGAHGCIGQTADAQELLRRAVHA